jgi:hypothetical protein
MGGCYYRPELAFPREYMLRFEHPGTPHDAFIGLSAPSTPEPEGVSSSGSLTAPTASRTTPTPLSAPPLHSAGHASLPTSANASSSERGRRTGRTGWKGYASVGEDYIPHSTTYVDVIHRCKSRTRSGRL